MLTRHLWRETTLGLLGIGLAAVVTAQQAPGPEALPLSLAYSAKTVGDRPAVSRDGRILAYGVRTPPERSPEYELADGVRFLPGGTPPSMVGLRAFVVSTRGGQARGLCPEAANCWRPSPSPDGSRIAFFSDAGGMPQLWVYDVAKGESKRVAEAPIKAKHWPGDEAAWSADSRELFVPLRPPDQESPGAPLTPARPAAADTSLSTPLEKPTVTVYSTGLEAEAAPERDTSTPDSMRAHFIRENNATLAAIDVVTGRVRVVVPADAEPRPSCMRLSPDGKWVSYLSIFKTRGETASTAYYDLAVAPASGGKPALIAANLQVPAGEYFENTYRWLPGSKQIVFLKDKKLWIASATSTRLSPRQLGASLGNLDETPLAVTSDGKGIVVGQEGEGKDSCGCSNVPPKSLAIAPIDGSSPTTFSSAGPPIMADRDTLWQPEPGRFVIVVNDETTGDRSIVSVDLHSAATSTLWKGRGRFGAVGCAEDGSIVARFESLDNPPDFYSFDPKFVSKRRLTHIEPRLDGVTVGAMEILTSEIPGFDGRLQPVQTAVCLPPGKKLGDRLPAIVYFYSGSKMSDIAQKYGGGAPNSIPVQVFATRGYAVLLMDVPLGPEGKGGNPIQEMGDAILAQVYRAAERGFVDISRVAILGQSYGGYSTAAMTTQTNLFRAAISLDGKYDLPGSYAHMAPGGASNYRWSETGQGRMGTHPWADLRRYLANSPYYQADKIHTPLLLIHGKKDDTCPVAEAEKMFNALKRLDKTAQLAVYDGEGHVPGRWSPVNAVDATQRMVDWLQKFMPPDTTVKP